MRLYLLQNTRHARAVTVQGFQPLPNAFPNLPLLFGLDPIRAAVVSCSSISTTLDRLYNAFQPLLRSGAVAGVVIFDVDLTSQALPNTPDYVNQAQYLPCLPRHFDLELRVIEVMKAASLPPLGGIGQSLPALASPLPSSCSCQSPPTPPPPPK